MFVFSYQLFIVEGQVGDVGFFRFFLTTDTDHKHVVQRLSNVWVHLHIKLIKWAVEPRVWGGLLASTCASKL